MDIWSDGVCLPEEPSYVLSPAFQEVDDTCLPEGSSEGIPSSTWLGCAASALPCEQFLSQPRFSHFYLSDSSPIPHGENKQAAV